MVRSTDRVPVAVALAAWVLTCGSGTAQAKQEHEPAPLSEVEAGSTREPETELNSPTMLGVGIACTVVGTLAIVGGAVWAVAGDSATAHPNLAPFLGGLTVAGGVNFALAGIPLTIAGAIPVPVESGDAELACCGASRQGRHGFVAVTGRF